MAIRNIRVLGDEILRKKAKEITEVTPRIQELIDDMFETMYDADGVGLAAPQVGIRKRLVVIDCGEEPLVLINPVILETSGEQTGQEGCLSVPNKVGIVTRPNYAKVKAYDENMQEYIIEGTELLARCLCHEIDHLDGLTVRYCGLGKGSTVSEGDEVKINDKIGNLSEIPAESADGTHFHIEAEKDGKYIDFESLLLA